MRRLWGWVIPAFVAGCSWGADPQVAELLGHYTWRAEGVGGLSGLEVSDDGRSFVVISDRGTRYDGQFQRDGGRITGVAEVTSAPILKRNGTPVRGGEVDAEGLACADPAPGAACDISFEGIHRVAYFAGPGAPALNRARPREFAGLQLNSGLEALALDPQGRLVAIPERSGQDTRPFPIYRLEAGNRWSQPYRLRREPPYLMVGTDFGPDGKLYVLERHFGGFGFASRVRRFTVSNDQITDEETLLVTPLGRHDNLEGLAVWQDAQGAIRLTMVSDDNFNLFQRTEFVEYRLTEAP